MKLNPIDPKTGYGEQDVREVQSGFSKTSQPISSRWGDETTEIVANRIEYLLEEMLCGNDDPLLPATQVGWENQDSFKPLGYNGFIGAIRVESGRYFVRHLRTWAYPIPIQVVSGTHWPGLASC